MISATPTATVPAVSARRFERIAIVNRGEPAMRLIRAVRELRQAGTGPAYRTIALYTDPDEHALFVREADESVNLGAAIRADPATGERRNAYLDYSRLESALVEAKAEAAWVGWGFVSEQAQFAELCERLGIVFIGPPPSAMRLLGDKIASKRLAEANGVPVGPWSGGPVVTLDDALPHARRIGFPLMVKSSAGGGGRGVRLVADEAALQGALEAARAEAAAASGDPCIFLERCVFGGRHVEVQVLCDGAGGAWALGVRDCSVQRRFQKVIEESASSILQDATNQALRSAALSLCVAAGYRGAGTVEFLLDPVTMAFSFLEVNTRLQVEHTVTEATTGLDLVKLQLDIAAGGRLEGSPHSERGHAIEARLYAEDPTNDFAPLPGIIDQMRLPGGPGIRVDAGVAEGDVMPAEFDSMIAKIVAWGSDRAEALGRLTRAMEETRVAIRDGSTNRAFLVRLLRHPDMRLGDVDVTWVERSGTSTGDTDVSGARIALLMSAVEAYDQELLVERSQFLASAARGRPEMSSAVGRTIELSHHGLDYRFTVYRLAPCEYHVVGAEGQADLHVERLDRFERLVSVGGQRLRVDVVPQGGAYLVEFGSSSHRVSRADGGIVRAPSPAIVSAVLVQPGQLVASGTPIALLEAMKMITQVVAPMSGTVSRVFTSVNVQVVAGAPLMQIEAGIEEETARGQRITLTPANDGPEQPSERCLINLDYVRRVVMGFDADAADLAQVIQDQDELCPRLGRGAAEIRKREDEVLEIFADICSLSQRRLDVTDELGEEAHSQQEHFFAYLRSIDGEGGGLPTIFVHNLRRALAHYGVRDLERTPELEDAVFSIFRSQRLVEQQLPAIMSIVERRIEQGFGEESEGNGRLEDLLERIVATTQGRFPVLAELAREAQYRRFHQPQFDAARARVYLNMEGHLEHLARFPDAADRDVRMAAMVECPQPLQNLLTRRAQGADGDAQRLMLEVLTRRYYRIRPLEGFRTFAGSGRTFASARYMERGRLTHVLTAFGSYEDLEDLAVAAVPILAAVPEPEDAVLDLYVWRPDDLGDAAAVQQAVAASLARVAFPHGTNRVLVAVNGPGRGLGMAGTQHFTYRRTATGFEEDPILRGLHPMMAERVQMWRLANFRTVRLPSVEDVYLFDGVAFDNPKDERLFAIAEVRDLTPVRDASGRVVQLPHMERMFMEALAAIRRDQSRRPAGARLQGNRVTLYVWPPAEIEPADFEGIVNRLAASTEGLGMEKTVVQVRLRDPSTGELRQTALHFSNTLSTGVTVQRFDSPTDQPIQPLSAYRQKVVSMQRRGLVYPYEIVSLLAPPRADSGMGMPPGDFIEHDLDTLGRLVPVERPYGGNSANLVVGVIRNFTSKHPTGMRRVIVLGDPSRNLGALAEPECRRVVAALDLAQEMHVPLEWFTISSGARISMDSGTENMDWIAAVLRRIVEFTQAGGEINLVVNGINVGAQPYWNAEATMLMHTNGILVMTPAGAMVLTGKQALDLSGGVSADDNYGIGGYERIMGPNGQAQFWAPDLSSACQVLLRHYEHTYRERGERFPRRAETTDPRDRDVRDFPHPAELGTEFTRVGDIFSAERNPERKNPFDIRTLMSAVIDRDLPPLERWLGQRDAETAVVWDAHLGGYPVCLVGIESRPLTRRGPVPADGPQQWTAGTLFPQSSKKVARAINAATGNRPLVVLANLSGFDGSPESMRSLQLEYGAEIGRAVINFKGPIVFCVVSRYHGGAFVVFSWRLNESLEIAAIEGSYASVIGGAPAAGVVFAGEVDRRTRSDTRVTELEQAISGAAGTEKAVLRGRLAALLDAVRAEKLGEVAAEFDSVHNVQRALRVGSIHRIIPAAGLRPYLIEAVERGMRKELAKAEAQTASPA